MRRKNLTYAESGVDIKQIDFVQHLIAGHIQRTHENVNKGRVLSGFGHYAGLIDIGSCILALHCDGVGTKLLIAQAMNNFSTVGVDCIAMNVNDLICVGSTPFAFVDYIATAKPDPPILLRIAKSLVEGAKESGVAIIGGETAVVPGLLSNGYSKNSIELSGTAIGFIQKRSKLVLGNRIRKGDIILGVESSGLHSNGFTLVRRAFSRRDLRKEVGNLKRPLGDELLIPTRIYVRPMIDLFGSGVEIHGIAHITGGAFTKLQRINDRVNYRLVSMPDPPEIFRLIQAEGKIGFAEMYRTFNMGIGLCIIAPLASAEAIVSTFNRWGMRTFKVGFIEKPGTGEVSCEVLGHDIKLR
jgi:phosphoribosylformylglycinamidine cyclo-ligase